jgi:hypothetical protein
MRHEARARPGEHRAEHEELAVGDVDDAHHAEDQRKPERGQREDERADRALEEREEKMRPEAQSACFV